MAGLIKGKLGLKQMRIALSGAGAIKPDTVAFFHKLKIDILNVYGQSESTGGGTLTTPHTFDMKKTGSIGKVLPGTKIRYVNTEFGNELQLFGRHIMLGYLNKAAKTGGTVDGEGWLATGDIAETDEDGYVWLTGRSKEIMKNHGGEMIAPVLAEQSIEKACAGLVAKVIVVGDKEYYLSALVMLPEELDGTEPTGRLAGAAKGVVEGVSTITEAQNSTQYSDMLKECFADYNTNLALNRVARVFRFTILDHAINTEDQDLMTPTQKLKRDGVMTKFSEEYSKCYPCSNIVNSDTECDASEWDGRGKEVLPCQN
jgi:long-chain-fatty-acid--CoA ligase ACSBG